MKTSVYYVALVAFVLVPFLAFSQITMYTDSFESGSPSLKWGRYRVAEDTVRAVTMATAPVGLTGGGSYVGFLQDVDASYSGAAIALAGSSYLQDYSIEADVYCYVGQSTSAYTGLCVYSDSAKGTYIKLTADFDVSQRLRLSNNKLDPNTFLPTFDKSFTGAAVPGGIPTTDGWHKMKIEVRTMSTTKTGLWCYFDGNLLGGGPVIDSSVNVMRSGKFGLYSFQQDADGIPGYFDNVVVKLLPTTASFTENFESGTPNSQWVRYRFAEDTLQAVPMATAPAALGTGGSKIGFLQDVNASYSGAAIALAGTTNLRDYSIEADVYCFVGQSTSAYTGLCVYSDSLQGIYIKLTADFDVSQRLRLSNNKLDPNTFLPTFDKTFSASSIPGGVPTTDGWHKMKVEVRTLSATKTSFSCYFDGNLLTGSPVIDSSVHVMNAGQFGVYSFQQDADGIPGYFDNIVVQNLLTSVEENASSFLPSGIQLRQNYPNPFNPTTVITYRLSVPSHVDLRVFDMLGREVAVLASGENEAGLHVATFNGAGLASGLYFYRLTAGSLTETRKMLLTK